jgi:carboxylate-amine ligase
MGLRTMGVEEEFLLVDPETGRPLAVAAAVLAAQQADADADPAGRSASGSRSGTVEAELQSQQIETSTVPCTGLDELMREITRARARSSDVARAGGAEIVALGTSPISVDASLFPAGRYQRMASRFGMTADEQLSCGCHVHVQVDSDEEAIGVLDQIRPWLSVLLAVSANSPFWHGADSGYASYGTQVWSRWPSAGPTDLFGTPIVYHQAVRAMINSATILDEGWFTSTPVSRATTPLSNYGSPTCASTPRTPPSSRRCHVPWSTPPPAPGPTGSHRHHGALS